MLNLKILNEKQKKLLDRKEVELEAIYDKATPKKEEMLKEISSLLKIKENLIVLKKINQIFGASKAKVLVYVYASEESLKKVEPKEKKSKEKKEEKPTQAPKQGK